MAGLLRRPGFAALRDLRTGLLLTTALTVLPPVVVPPVVPPVTPPAIEAGRIATITTDQAGRPPTKAERLAYADIVAADMAGTDMGLDRRPAITHTVARTGRWSDAATWVGGRIPGGDPQNPSSIDLPTGFDLTLDTPGDYHLGDFRQAAGSGFTVLPAAAPSRFFIDTWETGANARVSLGTWKAPLDDRQLAPGQAALEVVWTARGSLPGGPSTRLGWMSMQDAKIRVHGRRKAFELLFDVAPVAGDGVAGRPFRMAGDVSSWRVGDIICIPTAQKAGSAATDPKYTGPANFWNDTPVVNGHGVPGADEKPAIRGALKRTFKLSRDEVRTITAIDAANRTITVDAALAYAHPHLDKTLPDGTAVPFRAKACMLTHSVRFRSADPSSVQTRGHLMFSYSANVQLRFFECRSMGRTDTNPSLEAKATPYLFVPTTVPGNQTAKPPAGYGDATKEPYTGGVWDPIQNVTWLNSGTSLANPDNVRGRYPLHFHFGGAYFWRKGCGAYDYSVWSPLDEMPTPGWASVGHFTWHHFENANIFHTRGAHMVSERGNEGGQWANVNLIFAMGDGFDTGQQTRPEWIENHNGSSGVGAECQARGILMHHVNIYSCRYATVLIKQTSSRASRVPDRKSLRLLDPITWGGKNGLFQEDNDTYGDEQEPIPEWRQVTCVDCNTGLLVGHRQDTDREDTTPSKFTGFHGLLTGRPVDLTSYTGYYYFYDCVFDTGDLAINIGTQSWQVMFVNCAIRNFARRYNDAGINYQGALVDCLEENVGHPGELGRVDIGFPVTEHPFYGVMDTPANVVAGTARTDGSGGGVWFLRKPRILNSQTDLPWAFPGVGPYPDNPSLGPIGLAADPFGGKALPADGFDFMWEAGGTTELPYAGKKSFSFRGYIKDRVGTRRYPDAHTIQNNKLVDLSKRERTNLNIEGGKLVQNAGCWLDTDGRWKTRWQFVEIERLSGRFHVATRDMELAAAFPTALLEANRSFSAPGVYGPPPLPDTDLLLETSAPAVVDPTPDAPAPTPDPAIFGGAFTLQDEQGAAVTEALLLGRWSLLYGGYTHCPDVCPTELGRMLDLRDAVPAANLRPVYVTVDPARDTPAVMRDYVALFSEPELRGLSGSQAQVDGFRAAYLVAAARIGSGTDYRMTHTTNVFLVNPAGRCVDVFGPQVSDTARADRVRAAVAAYS